MPTASGTNATVEFEMYWSGGDNQMVVSFPNFSLWLDGGNIGFNTGNSDLYGTTSAGLANRWVHVVAVFHNGNPTGSQLYLDGVKQTLSEKLGTTPTSGISVGTSAVIGAYAFGGLNFGGRLQEVATYSSALAAGRQLSETSGSGATVSHTGSTR